MPGPVVVAVQDHEGPSRFPRVKRQGAAGADRDSGRAGSGGWGQVVTAATNRIRSYGAVRRIIEKTADEQ